MTEQPSAASGRDRRRTRVGLRAACRSRLGRGRSRRPALWADLAEAGLLRRSSSSCPIVWAIVLSLRVGLDPRDAPLRRLLTNYQRLCPDSLFRISLENTLIYAVIVIPVVIVGGLVLAALLNRPIRFRSFFRVSLILPTVTPTVAAAVIWIYLLQGKGGVFNSVLGFFGVGSVLWLGNPHLVIPMIAMIECLARDRLLHDRLPGGHAEHSAELYQAAAIDGITGVRAFWQITVPLLRPVILFATVVATIFNLQIFDSPYVLTKGGPGYRLDDARHVHLQRGLLLRRHGVRGGDLDGADAADPRPRGRSSSRSSARTWSSERGGALEIHDGDPRPRARHDVRDLRRADVRGRRWRARAALLPVRDRAHAYVRRARRRSASSLIRRSRTSATSSRRRASGAGC